MKIAIIGMGKMGRAVRDVALARGHAVAAELDVGQVKRESLNGAQVAIEFTEPDAAAANLVALASWNVPAVTGTTGWYARLPEVTAAVTKAGSALVYAPNFSLGVQLLRRLARETGRFLARHPGFDAQVIDVHNRLKKDSPSGTGIALRDTLRKEDPSRDYPINSIRLGEVPGTHEIVIDGGAETVTLAHVARDRSVFARGALTAAEWLVAQPRTGIFTFEQVLFGDAG